MSLRSMSPSAEVWVDWCVTWKVQGACCEEKPIVGGLFGQLRRKHAG
jgi:hypothetical protein